MLYEPADILLGVGSNKIALLNISPVPFFHLNNVLYILLSLFCFFFVSRGAELTDVSVLRKLINVEVLSLR